MPGILLGTGDAMESKPDVAPAFSCSQCGNNNRQLNKKNLQHAKCGHRAVEAEQHPLTYMGHPTSKLEGPLGPYPHLGPCIAFKLHLYLPTSEN